MTRYNLKVEGSTLTSTGSQLTQLTPVDPHGPGLGLITALKSTTNLGNGSLAFNAATVNLVQATITRINNRVHDGNLTKVVTVHFNVASTGTLSGFEDSYST